MSEWLKKFFSVFQNFKIFFWKMASMGRGKWWEKQTHEIWAHFEHPPRNHERSSTRGGSVNPLPCRIGLKYRFTIENRANSSHVLRYITLSNAYDTYTIMAGKMSIFIQIRSHITNFDDLEATEDFLKLASGLCFTFFGVGSNPTWCRYNFLT